MSIGKNILKLIINDQKYNQNDLDIVEREIYDKVNFNSKNKEIVIITGIRRCGKSTLLNEFRNKQKYSNYYLNFDDFRLAFFEVLDFQKLEESFLELFGIENIFYFDEIQNINYWERYIRTLYDKNKKIYLTGSNASMLSYELGTHLTGRNIKIEMFPFSFSEFLKFKKVKVEKDDFFITEKRSLLKKEFLNYLNYGGFPQFVKTKNKDILKEIYKDILFKDIIVRHKLKDEKTIQELCYLLVSNISKEISFNKLKNILNLSNMITVKNYLSYLENSYLFFTINKFDYSLKKQIYDNKKIYIIDTSLINVISFKFSEDFGRQLENIVFMHFKRKSIYEIFYHKKKFECDFLLKEKDKIVKAVQVTKSLNYDNEKREVMGLVEASNEYNLKEGLLLTYEDDEREFIKEGIKIKVRQIWKYLLE